MQQGCALSWANGWTFGPRANGTRSVPDTLRRGMTLIELLVVVAIILFAAAVFVPRLKPMMDHSKVREAARVIQLYLSTARNQAMSTGRSCGVMIEPLPSDTGCSMTLTQVETPAPYGGDLLGSTATVTLPQNGSQLATITLSSSASIPIHYGDLVQVGYQGFWMNVITQNNAVLPAGTTTFTAQKSILTATARRHSGLTRQ